MAEQRTSERPDERRTVGGVCVALAALTLMVFGRTLTFGFVNYDDGPYVTENPMVQQGLTWEGFRWSLTFGEIGHWHPLTWLSHMLDCQIWGLQAGGHHLTNVLLHTASVVLLFLALRRMTGSLWKSAFVAAVFAIHPLRAESVAWIAERKDVLSALFFMLTLGAYVRYVQLPHSMLRYGVVALLFALGLLSKNMLVTLPFVLLLLDYWPLNRVSGFDARVWVHLVIEKIPLFLLTIGSCVATALVSEKVAPEYRLSLAMRMENALICYVTYLWQMIHPLGLTCLYPLPAALPPLWEVLGALGLLVAISGVAMAFGRTRPYVMVGWLWYMGMTLPVMGIVQISYYAHADRYTYLPQIGLYVLVTWAVADFTADWRHQRLMSGIAAGLALAALSVGAFIQTSYWRDSESLWRHALACTADNAVAHDGLGNALLEKGRPDEAVDEFQKALEIDPKYGKAHNNLGSILAQRGQLDQAIGHFEKALAFTPGDAMTHNNLGSAYLQKRRVDDAIAQYRQALAIEPNSVMIRRNLGRVAWVLAASPDDSLRNGARAVEVAQEALQQSGGNDPVGLEILAAAYAETGKYADAMATAEQAQRLAAEQSNFQLAGALQAQVELYQSGRPVRDPSLAPRAPSRP
jgi:protein O-mannosyl-transferase